MTAREELAAVLAEHSLRRVTCGDDWIWECAAPECVWVDSRDVEGLDAHRIHVADALLSSPAFADLIRDKQADAWQEGHGAPECHEWVVPGLCPEYHPNPYRNQDGGDQ